MKIPECCVSHLIQKKFGRNQRPNHKMAEVPTDVRRVPPRAAPTSSVRIKTGTKGL